MRNTLVVAALAIVVVTLAIAAWWYRPGSEPPAPAPNTALTVPGTMTGSGTDSESPASNKSAPRETAAQPVGQTTATAKTEARAGADADAKATQSAPKASAMGEAKPTVRETPAKPSMEAAKPSIEAAKPSMKAAKSTMERAEPKATSAPDTDKPAMDEPKAPTTAMVETKPAKADAAKPKPEQDKAAIEPPTPPSFDIVRIERDGTAVIAGRALPGAEVTLRLGGKTISSATANGRGEWVAVISDPLPPGASNLELQASRGETVLLADNALAVIVPDRPESKPMMTAEAGKAAPASGQSDTTMATEGKQTNAGAGAALAVLVPKGGDTRPRLLQKPEPTGQSASRDLTLDSVDYDDKGNVVLSGNAPAGSTVRTYIDNKPAGESKAGDDKAWEVKPPSNLPAGNYTLRVDQVDDEGKVTSRVELPFTRVSADKVLAASAAHYRVVVQPGNSLWRIARRVYGRGVLYTVIYRANDEQIGDPDMIFPGQIFDLPETRQN